MCSLCDIAWLAKEKLPPETADRFVAEIIELRDRANESPGITRGEVMDAVQRICKEVLGKDDLPDELTPESFQGPKVIVQLLSGRMRTDREGEKTSPMKDMVAKLIEALSQQIEKTAKINPEDFYSIDRVVDLDPSNLPPSLRFQKALPPAPPKPATAKPPEKGPDMATLQAGITLSAAKKPEAKPDPDGLKFKDVRVERAGEKIILPEEMSLDEAAVWIDRRRKQEETIVKVSHKIDCYPVEGAYALLQVLESKYGYSDVQDQIVQTMFGPMPKPATMIGVEIEPGVTIQVPWGRVELPNIAGYLQAGFHIERDRTVKFELVGEIKRKSEGVVNEIVTLLKEFVRTKSVFRGKALEIRFPDPDREGEFAIDPGYLPKILDVSGVKEEELIFPADVEEMVQTSLFAPVEHTQACRDLLIPLKRGVLLEGPYGTGKTLTAFVLAKKAVKNGWTFLYVKHARDLDRAISMARQYQPAIVFTEDVDSAVAGDERTEEINNILNTLDGVDSKTQEVMVIVTTNHVENITKALLRPGRLDSVVPVRPPDAAAAVRLMRLYGRHLIDPNEDLNPAGEKLAGHIPAFIREAVERSKLSAIRHVKPGEALKVTCNDLVTAANGMEAQIALLRDNAKPVWDSRKEAAADVLGKHIAGAAAAVVAAITPVAKNGTAKKETGAHV